MVDSSTTDANNVIRHSNFPITNEFDLANDENLEELFIVWVDSNVNKMNDCLEMISTLRSIINSLKIFDNIDECIYYINSITTEEKIFLIVSGSFGESIVPHICQSLKIVAIYVFCYDKTKYEIWLNQYKPFQGVFTEKDYSILN